MDYDGRKIDKWFQHEGLDRVHCILAHIGAVLGDEGDYHPSIHNERCKNALYKAQLSLGELYQAIGEWDESGKYITSLEDNRPFKDWHYGLD